MGVESRHTEQSDAPASSENAQFKILPSQTFQTIRFPSDVIGGICMHMVGMEWVLKQQNFLINCRFCFAYLRTNSSGVFPPKFPCRMRVDALTTQLHLKSSSFTCTAFPVRLPRFGAHRQGHIEDFR